MKSDKTEHIDEIDDLVGSAGYNGPAKSLEEMDEAIAKGVEDSVSQPKSSTASIIISLVFGLGLWLLFLGICFLPIPKPRSVIIPVIICSICIACVMNFLGIILGIFGVYKSTQNKTRAKVGLRLNTLFFILVSILGGIIYFVPKPPLSTLLPDERFKDVTKIEFSIFELHKKYPATFSIMDPQKIKALTQTIRIRPKLPCKCQPHSRAKFHTKNGIIETTFCDHCFEIKKANGKTELNKISSKFCKLVQNYKKDYLKASHGDPY